MKRYTLETILKSKITIPARNMSHAISGFRDCLVLSGYGVSIDRANKLIESGKITIGT